MNIEKLIIFVKNWYRMVFSCWDIKSQNFISQFNTKKNKIASAMLTNHELIDVIIEEKKHTFISTGMHTIEEIKRVVDKFKKKLSF